MNVFKVIENVLGLKKMRRVVCHQDHPLCATVLWSDFWIFEFKFSQLGGRHVHPREHESIIDYWHNALTKTNGEWYSTWKDGECRPDDVTQTFCGWKVLNAVKRVDKKCSDNRINAIIELGDRNADGGCSLF